MENGRNSLSKSMKIVLAEDRGGKLVGERTFTSEIVRVGRDPAECHYFFTAEQWPMVSRKHAEFRLGEGRCLVADSNSRFGTFVNGQKIAAPVEVRVGANVQLGAGGPILRVVSIEQTAVSNAAPVASELGRMETFRESKDVAPAATPPPVAPPQPPAGISAQKISPTPKTPAASAKATPAYLELTQSGTEQAQRIELTKEVTRLGRDPEGEVVIDADAAIVSRRHAEIRRAGEQFAVTDLKSFNGTLVNGQRIAGTVTLFGGDQIQLGAGGPVVRVVDPAHPAPAGSAVADAQRPVVAPSIPPAFGQIAAMAKRETIVVSSSSGSIAPTTPPAGTQPHLLARRSFEQQTQFTVGRASDNDIRLDGLQISNRHARFMRTNGSVAVEDAGSTNGVYVNGERIGGKRAVQPSDVIQIGPFVLQADAKQGVAVYDTRSKTRIDAINIAKVVANRSGGGKIKLLDDVGLTIQPNEFVGLLG